MESSLGACKHRDKCFGLLESQGKGRSCQKNLPGPRHGVKEVPELLYLGVVDSKDLCESHGSHPERNNRCT